jgi:hypothetical protein
LDKENALLTDKLWGKNQIIHYQLQNSHVEGHKRTCCHRLIGGSDLKLVEIGAIEVALVARG